MNRCKHGMIEGQCFTCRTGPIGYDGRDKNVYGDIDYLDMPEDEPVDKVKQRVEHAAAGVQEFARYSSDDLIIGEIETEEFMAEKKICIISGCENERFARGLCKTHYWRWQKNQGKTGIEPLPSKTRGKNSGEKPKAGQAQGPAPTELVEEREVIKMADVVVKKCSNCGEPKDLEKDFAKKPGCKDGYEGQCKQCRVEKARIRRLKKQGEYTGPTTGEKGKPEVRGQRSEVGKRKSKDGGSRSEDIENKKPLAPSTGNPGDVKILSGDDINLLNADEIVPTAAFDIMKLELENKTAVREAAKFIIESVKKDLLGAVFAELRNKG